MIGETMAPILPRHRYHFYLLACFHYGDQTHNQILLRGRAASDWNPFDRLVEDRLLDELHRGGIRDVGHIRAFRLTEVGLEYCQAHLGQKSNQHVTAE